MLQGEEEPRPPTRWVSKDQWASKDRVLSGATEIVAGEIEVRTDLDVIEATSRGRQLALWLGFCEIDVLSAATTIAELGRNILEYAHSGQIILKAVHDGSRYGVVVTARDSGRGIPDVDIAVQEGYSTSGQPGLGLAWVRRLMDECTIVSTVGEGTEVTAKKWPSSDSR